jgi:hypothetical protein
MYVYTYVCMYVYALRCRVSPLVTNHLRAQQVQDHWGSTDPRSSRQVQRPEDTIMMETSPDVSPRLPPVSFGHAEPARVETHGTPDGGREAASTNPQPRKPTPTRPFEPTPTVRTASWASDQIPYSDDPYLARMRANVAALGEVTAKLRESVSLDQRFDTHSRSIMLESEVGADRGAAAGINTAQIHATSYRSVVHRVLCLAVKLKQGNEPRASVPPSTSASLRVACPRGNFAWANRVFPVVLPSAGNVPGIWMCVRVHDNVAPARAHTRAAGWAKTLMAAPHSTPTRSCAA